MRVRPLTFLVVLLATPPARAITGIGQEEDVADLLVTRSEAASRSTSRGTTR